MPWANFCNHEKPSFSKKTALTGLTRKQSKACTLRRVPHLPFRSRLGATRLMLTLTLASLSPIAFERPDQRGRLGHTSSAMHRMKANERSTAKRQLHALCRTSAPKQERKLRGENNSSRTNCSESRITRSLRQSRRQCPPKRSTHCLRVDASELHSVHRAFRVCAVDLHTAITRCARAPPELLICSSRVAPKRVHRVSPPFPRRISCGHAWGGAGKSGRVTKQRKGKWQESPCA